MKMNRLIGILSILLQREKVTAPELAEQFEVSRRNIQRNIKSLCRAGIPIATAQGARVYFGANRFHHEIYLSDVRRCKPEKLKTVIRQPIKRAE